MTEVFMGLSKSAFAGAAQVNQQPQQGGARDKVSGRASYALPNLSRVCPNEVFVPAGTSQHELNAILARHLG